MPRGYLKNTRSNEGRKRSRGGSSHRSPKKDPKGSKRGHGKSCPRKDGSHSQDFTLLPVACEKATVKTPDIYAAKAQTDPIDRCAICLQGVPVLRLFQNCRHASACKSCLRQYYIRYAQSDVTQYPLRCFHPSCDLVLQVPQMTKIMTPKSEQAEITTYHRMTTLAKGYRRSDSLLVVHCPSCDFPRSAVRGTADAHDLRIFECRSCLRHFGTHRSGRVVDENGVRRWRQNRARNRASLTNEQLREMKLHRRRRKRDLRQYADVIHFLENLERDKKGINDGWARCPGCKIMISKGDGCDHMTCVCGRHFSWSVAGGSEPVNNYNI